MHEQLAALPGERSPGREGSRAAGSTPREPSRPPAWLIGEVDASDIRRALAELVLLAVLAVLLFGGDK